MEDADCEFAQMGRVRENTIHSILELAEGIFEEWGRNLAICDTYRDRILSEGKERADIAEEFMLNDLRY